MSNLPNNYFELNAIYAFQLEIDSSKDVKKKTLMITKNIIFYRKKMCLMFKSNLFCAAYYCCITGQITFSHLYKGRRPYLTQFELLHILRAKKVVCPPLLMHFASLLLREKVEQLTYNICIWMSEAEKFLIFDICMTSFFLDFSYLKTSSINVS